MEMNVNKSNEYIFLLYIEGKKQWVIRKVDLSPFETHSL